jgi:hypothetical protein
MQAVKIHVLGVKSCQCCSATCACHFLIRLHVHCCTSATVSQKQKQHNKTPDRIASSIDCPTNCLLLPAVLLLQSTHSSAARLQESSSLQATGSQHTSASMVCMQQASWPGLWAQSASAM